MDFINFRNLWALLRPYDAEHILHTVHIMYIRPRASVL